MKNFTRSVIQYMIFMVVLLLLLQLGLWQLKRAEQKSQILQTFKHHQAMRVHHGAQDVQLFARVTLAATARSPILYLDNQFYQHQFGYHVLCVLRSDDGQNVLADLGWIAGDVRRMRQPITALPLRRTWQGYAYLSAKHPMSLGQWLEHEDAKSLVIESVDLAAIEAHLNIKLVPWVLRVNESPLYQANWPLVSVQPSRHRAYALQWFAMAVIWCLIFLWRMIKK